MFYFAYAKAIRELEFLIEELVCKVDDDESEEVLYKLIESEIGSFPRPIFTSNRALHDLLICLIVNGYETVAQGNKSFTKKIFPFGYSPVKGCFVFITGKGLISGN